jgi:hypothetical protein
VGTIDPARAAIGAKARGMGIPLDVGDLSDSRFIRMLSSTVKDLPMNGSGPAQAAKQTGINRAVAQTFGETADRITPDVMARARDRLGNYLRELRQQGSRRSRPMRTNGAGTPGRLARGESSAASMTVLSRRPRTLSRDVLVEGRPDHQRDLGQPVARPDEQQVHPVEGGG